MRAVKKIVESVDKNRLPPGVDLTALGLFLFLGSRAGNVSIRRIMSGAGLGWSSLRKRLVALEKAGWLEVYPSGKKGGLTIQSTKKMSAAGLLDNVIKAMARRTVAGKRALKANDVALYYILLTSASVKKVGSGKYVLKMSAREIKEFTGLDYATAKRSMRRLEAARVLFMRPGVPALRTKNTFTLVC